MRSIRQAPKRAINLSLNSRILEMAKDMGLNISQTVDELLTEAVIRRHLAEWSVNNKAAIEQYNARIASEGTFAESIRRHLSEQGEAAEPGR